MESTRETITFGQINMLLVVLILADLLFAVPRDRRWAGVGVGLATALKLFPGIFIVYLLVDRAAGGRRSVASATAAAATLVAAAFAPQDSWRFWTHELWATDRVGRTDYTGNQSLFGPAQPAHRAGTKPAALLWPLLAALVVAYGLWRAARAARARDWTAGLALAGLVGVADQPDHLDPPHLLVRPGAGGARRHGAARPRRPAARRAARRWLLAALAAGTTC